MYRNTLIFSLFLTFQPGAFLSAQQAQPDQSGVVDTIIVTATRSEISLRDATVPVTVIGREQIEQSLASDLAELLRFEAGLDIARNGGPGQATSVFQRGTESNHTLVLVDGVRINPGTIGGAPIQHIAPELIERVEIVKGARSALYGTDAIGGVVNIITRQPAESRIEGALGAGSFNTRSGFVNGGFVGDAFEMGATVNWNATDGYAIRTDSDIERGYENLSLNLYGMGHIGNADVAIRHWQTTGTVEYLDFFVSPLDQDFADQSTSFELANAIGDTGHSKLLLSYFVDEIQQNQSDDFVESTRWTLDWQYDVELSNHNLAAGVYLVDENAASLSFGAGFDEDTDQQAVFLQDHFTYDRHNVFVAVRYSDYKTFGDKLTWNAEYAIEINEQWTVNAGLGHAFRAPDATDLFGFGGNVDLRPEVADELQLGVSFSPTLRQKIRLELYRDDIRDLIEFSFSTFTVENTGRAEIRGAQLGYELSGERFTLRADLLKQTAENAITGERLLRRPEESLTVTYTRNFGNHRAGISVLASGDREDFATSLPGYLLINLTGQVQIGRAWQLNARIENLLDTKYQTADPYRMQERSGFVELKFAWE